MTTDFLVPRPASSATSPISQPAVAGLATLAPQSAPRGHAWSYAGLWFFTLLLIFRPSETVPGLQGAARLSFGVAAATLGVFCITQMLLEGRLTARPREVNLILALCGAALISMAFSIDRAGSRQMFLDVFIKAVLMFLVMVNAVRTEKRLLGMFYLTLAAGVFLAYGAISAYRMGAFTDEGYRVRGTLGATLNDPNDTALFLATMIPLAIALFLSLRPKLPRLLMALATLIMAAAIFVTYSRGGFLALSVAGAVLVWKIGRRAPLLTAGFSVVALLVILAALPPNYAARLSSITDASRDTRGSATARRALLNRSVEVALSHPVVGVGMGNFPLVSIRGYASHNAYTQVASEMGLPALALYLGFILAPIARLHRIERETRALSRTHEGYKRVHFFAIGLQASLMAYMVGSFFLSVAYYWFIYYLVGYAVCVGRIYETGPGRVVGTFEIACPSTAPLPTASAPTALA